MSDPVSFLDGRVVLHAGDCRDVLKTLADNSIDAVVTDPPYALVSIGKRFGKAGAKPAARGKGANATGAYTRAAAGFMGKAWDNGEAAFAETFWREVLRVLKPGGHVVAFSGTRTYHRLACAIEDAGFEIRDQLAWTYGTGFPKSHNLDGDWDGWGTALKPAWEPIALARKPLTGTVAANMLAYGTGAINLDGCRVGDVVREAAFTSLAPCKGNRLGAADTAAARRGTQGEAKVYVGRHPANIVHDGSDEVLAAFPETSGSTMVGEARPYEPNHGNSVYGAGMGGGYHPGYGDGSGSAARFFYSAKADDDDRLGSKHPTIKPVDLMQWLCRLVTPPGGTVLDPFAGTGTTGEAAFREGFNAVLVEREAEYRDDIARRMALALAGPATRKREAAKAKAGAAPADHGPLFEMGSAA